MQGPLYAYFKLNQWVHILYTRHHNIAGTVQSGATHHSYTVEPVLKDHPIGHKNMVSQDRWSLATDSFKLKYWTFCQNLMVLKDRWSLIAAVSQDSFTVICNLSQA